MARIVSVKGQRLLYWEWMDTKADIELAALTFNSICTNAFSADNIIEETWEGVVGGWSALGFGYRT